MYVGQNKCVICIAVFGEAVELLKQSDVGHFCDLMALKPRLGQHGVLYWGEGSKKISCVRPIDAADPSAFEYDTSAVTRDLATWQHVQEYSKGEFIAPVIRTQSVEDRYTQTETEELFLQVYGHDISGLTGVQVTPMREVKTYRLTGGNGIKILII